MLHAKIQDHNTSGSGEDVLDFHHIWAWRPSWSCDLDDLYKLLFPLPKEAPHKIWLLLAKRFQRRNEEKRFQRFEIVVGRTDDDDAGRRTMGVL